MPEYSFTKDILVPYLKASKDWKKQSTLRTQEYDSRPLERIFAAHYVTLQPRDLCVHRKIITGEIVSHYRSRRKLEGVAPVTIARELSLASSACKWAIGELNFDIPNPFEGRLISRADARAVKPRTRVLADSEQNSLLIALPQPARDMVLLYLETALRVTEARVLRQDQCDFEQSVIAFEPGDHKSGTFAAIALTDAAIEIIRRQPTVPGSPYVFHVDGQTVSQPWFRYAWERAREIAGCPDLQTRDLRRTALTKIRGKYGLEVAQAQARHANRKTTERVYARPSVEVALQAMRSTGKS
ncbi:MAG: tyrosine-type recombinase/integrase [Bradyrhizobium sp.]|uniref:tyrosine-type recombinase/integrase n=1 Tax=Bradyrhizobium sp. TaxID=376 RepID=UPI003D09B98E